MINLQHELMSSHFAGDRERERKCVCVCIMGVQNHLIAISWCLQLNYNVIIVLFQVVRHKSENKKIRAKQRRVSWAMWPIATDIGSVAVTINQSCMTVQMGWCLLVNIVVSLKAAIIHGVPITVMANNWPVSWAKKRSCFLLFSKIWKTLKQFYYFFLCKVW